MTKVVNENNELVQEKYENYSPVFLSAASILRGGVVFATYFAVITFAALWHGKTIWRSMKKAFRREAQLETFTDIHSVLMRSYEEVPEVSFPAEDRHLLTDEVDIPHHPNNRSLSRIHHNLRLAHRRPRL